MDSRYQIRPVTEPELPAFNQVGIIAFNSSWPLDQMLEFDKKISEPERTLAVLEGDRIVASALAYTFGLTVPGGVVEAAGVSGVSVLPSHRRRGLLSALMRRQLADVAERGEPVAALYASEAPIYGRFGYGSAADQCRLHIRRGEGQLRFPTPSEDAAEPRLALADPKQAVGTMKSVYEQVLGTRPGMVSRHGGWWDLVVADPEFMREGSSPQQCVLAEDDSGARGYALYSVKGSWGSDGLPAQELTVQELFAVDAVAYATLWADMLSRDLVGHVYARLRPVDDPLLRLLPDTRHARIRVTDGLWIRLVSVPDALERRRYAAPVDVVIEVTDHLLPDNGGRWRLTAGGLTDDAKPSCERSTTAADLSMPVSALGAGYLGGTRLGSLAAAGLLEEHRPGAVAELSAAMWWDPAPWPAVMF